MGLLDCYNCDKRFIEYENRCPKCGAKAIDWWSFQSIETELKAIKNKLEHLPEYLENHEFGLRGAQYTPLIEALQRCLKIAPEMNTEIVSKELLKEYKSIQKAEHKELIKMIYERTNDLLQKADTQAKKISHLNAGIRNLNKVRDYKANIPTQALKYISDFEDKMRSIQ